MSLSLGKPQNAQKNTFTFSGNPKATAATESWESTGRMFLVFRYSRTPCARVIYYGDQIELTLELLERRREQLCRDRAWEPMRNAFKWTRASDPLGSLVHRSQAQLRLVEEQLERVLALWRELLDIIERGAYAPPGKEPCPSFCTNAIDVRLLDALDTLRFLDNGAVQVAPNYKRIFVSPYRDTERGAVMYHSSLEWRVFSRIFADMYENA